MTDLFTQDSDERDLFIAFLQGQHVSLWGRSFDVKVKGAPAAADWFLAQRDSFEKWKAER